MRIAFLSEWFTPEPTFKGLSFAKAFTAMGHQVQVVTGYPNYPEGKIYPGYKVKIFQREFTDGVEVLRFPLYPSHDSSKIHRITTYATFALSASFLAPWVLNKPDVMYVYHPPATIGIPASVISRILHVPVVLDVQDLWPDTLRATGIVSSSKALSVVDSLCRYMYRNASAITVLSPGFKRALVERGVPTEKVELIYNWCDEDSIECLEPDSDLIAKLGLTDKFRVVFTGTMGKAQNLEVVLDAAKMLSAIHPNIHFLFVGGGVAFVSLQKYAQDLGISNASFVPRVPYSKISPYLALGDVLLVHLKDDPLFSITIPGKTQAYLKAGRPILMAVGGDAADLVRRAGAGQICEPGNSEQIATAIEAFYNTSAEQRRAMGQNGRRFYGENLCMETAVKRYERIFEQVARTR